jgi:phosphohistidine phosphatase
MLRRLIVLRHAKSDWDTDAATDHERPLNKRGRRDAPRVADHMAELGWKPEKVFSSDARRTRETWKRMRKAFDSGIKAKFTKSLYHTGIGAVREVVASVPDKVETVMVIGHNPGWESVIDTLTGEEVRLTTCNAALLSIEADSWADAISTDAAWNLDRVLRPKDLKDAKDKDDTEKDAKDKAAKDTKDKAAKDAKDKAAKDAKDKAAKDAKDKATKDKPSKDVKDKDGKGKSKDKAKA